MNSLLYGTGTKKILATETVPNQTNMSQVWYADGSSEYIPYKNFIYLNSQDPVIDSLYDNTDIQELFGSNHFDCIVHTDNWGLINYIKNNAKDYYLPFLQSQWMIQSGETQFKGMDFDEPLRWYIDIEVYSTYEFVNAQREEDQVIMISVCDNKGWERLWRLDQFESEADLLKDFIKTLREHNPTIMIFHNGFGFDLPYLRDRCLLHGVKFQIGRDGSEPNTFTTSIKFAEKSDEYENFQVYGRHVLDTMFMAKQYDIFARTLDGYGLKYCAGVLGREERTDIDGDQIADYWDDPIKREELAKYAMDDVRDTRILDEEWGGAVFEMTKMIPLPMQDVARYGMGNLIDLLFNRYYYDNMWSWAKADQQRHYGGGYAQTFQYGYIGKDCIYEDISSLYPSLAELLEVQPYKDELKLFSKLIPLLKELRYKAKYSGEKAKDSVLKRMLNTASYGWLGWAFGAFNDYSEAEKITEWGQRVIKQVNKSSQNLGAQILKTDTDGTLVIVPDKWKGSEDTETKFIKEVESDVNSWMTDELGYKTNIVLEHDGRYKQVVLFDDKSYVLVAHDDSRTVKGNTLTGRNLEAFTRDFFQNCLNHILAEQTEKITDEYNYYKDLVESQLLTVDQIKKRQTLNMSLEEYSHKIEAGQNRIAQYEAALSNDRPMLKGDVIETWVEQPEKVLKEYKTRPDKWVTPNLPAFETIRLAKNYNGNLHVDHYLSRLNKTAQKLLVVLGWDQFKEILPDVPLRKTERRKMIPVLGLERFVERFPDYNYIHKDITKLRDEDIPKFKKLTDEKYHKLLDNYLENN